MVSEAIKFAYSFPIRFATKTRSNCQPCQQTTRAFDGGKTETTGMQVIGKNLQAYGICEKASSIIMASWRDGTKKQYDSYLKKWFLFWDKRKRNPFAGIVSDIIDFLTEMLKSVVAIVLSILPKVRFRRCIWDRIYVMNKIINNYFSDL